MTSKYRESDKKAVGSYAFESLSRYFDVIRWAFCAAPLQVERAQWYADQLLEGRVGHVITPVPSLQTEWTGESLAR